MGLAVVCRHKPSEFSEKYRKIAVTDSYRSGGIVRPMRKEKFAA
jgi:hypothetical protein